MWVATFPSAMMTRLSPHGDGPSGQWPNPMREDDQDVEER